MTRPPFHLAFPVHDLDAARGFYGQVLGCREGRSSSHWVDFDFFGHQLVAHLASERSADSVTNVVDDHGVPVPHFGIVMDWDDWEVLAAKLRSAGVPFAAEPYVRFAGQPGEQGTFFVRDPSGNALEFKAFCDISRLFAT